MTEQPLLTVVVPVYKNEASIGALVAALDTLALRLSGPLECVFVIDASPDRSRSLLAEAIPGSSFSAVIVDHSRNFGSFAAIRTGMAIAKGRHIGVMAADLQEPPELMESFVDHLERGETQVVIGRRIARTSDARRDRAASGLYWRMYRRFVMPEIPEGGVDVFACTSAVRDQLIAMRETNSSLVGMLFWLGHPHLAVPYERQPRFGGGASSWTMRKKLRYMSDSIFSFTDLPLRALRSIGLFGLLLSLGSTVAVSIAWWRGAIDVPGYTPLILALLIATMMILSALGIVGAYVWRAFENTKGRPLSVIARIETIDR